MITLTLSTEEAQVLAALINIAVKAVGLEAAEAGLHFAKKLKAAAEPKAPEAPKAPEEPNVP
jgi:hypothetical protein